jgi:hypothetical protein
MSDNQVSDILAQAFAAEGVDTLFTLMGDANMYWSASIMSQSFGTAASNSLTTCRGSSVPGLGV